MDFTPTFHLDTYPSISPTKPSLLQTGRTIFITGGASGVGLAISRSFVEAGATRLVIVGRRAEILAEAKAELESLTSNSVEILTYPCDIVNETSVENVWKDLKAKSIHVEVLVLNAAIANTTPKGLAEEDLLGRIRETMEMNMFSALRLSNLFLRQGPAKGKVNLLLLCLSSSSQQDCTDENPGHCQRQRLCHTVESYPTSSDWLCPLESSFRVSFAGNCRFTRPRRSADY